MNQKERKRKREILRLANIFFFYAKALGWVWASELIFEVKFFEISFKFYSHYQIVSKRFSVCSLLCSNKRFLKRALAPTR